MMPIPHLTKPKDILQARGIYEEATLAGWIEQDAYWRYPILDVLNQVIAEREKRYPFSDRSKHKAKVRWHPSKPANLDSQWYITSKGYAAIKESGLMHVCNGEPSVLAMHAGGIDNVGSTTLSEVAFPKEGIAFLKRIGANRLIYLSDKDAAGLRSAINWRDALAGSGIDFEVMQWPASLPDKADANDAWIALDFDATAFQAMIASLAPLELPESPIKAKKQAPNTELDTSNLINALRSALEREGYLERRIYSTGFQECHCPFHDDKDSSAGFNIESGVLNCMGACGRAFSPYELAEHFGIVWRDFLPKQEKPKKAKTGVRRDVTVQEIQTALAVDTRRLRQPSIHVDRPIFINQAWINQPELPLSWIKGIFHLTHSKSITVLLAIELHRAIYQGLIDGQDFTMKDILSIFNHPRKSTTFAVEFLTSLNYVSILHTNLLEEGLKTKSTQKDSITKKGRPETHYRINTHTPSLAIALAERLEPVLLERLTEDLELAPRNHLLRDALDLELADFTAWAERTHTAKHDYITEFISQRICDVLESTSYIEFEAKDLEHPSNLRGKLMKLILEPYSEAIITLADGKTMLRERVGLQLSRAKLAWELGCSASALTNLYQENHIGTKEIYVWHEVLNPNDTDIEKEIREAPYNVNKEIGGVAYGGVLHYWEFGILKKTKLLSKADLVTEYRKHNFKIEKLYLQVQQPSLLWNMTHEEIADKRMKDAAIAAKELETADSPEERQTALKKLEKVQSGDAPKKKTTVGGKDRLYTGLSPEFVRSELEKEVKEVTPYILKGLAITNEATGEIIARLSHSRDVVIWLNQYKPEPSEVATSEDFTPKTEAILGAASETAKPIEAPKVVEKLRVKPVANSNDEWCWRDNNEEFLERMRSIGAKV